MVLKYESSFLGYRIVKKYINELYLCYRFNFFLDLYYFIVCIVKIFFFNFRVNFILVGCNLSF